MIHPPTNRPESHYEALQRERDALVPCDAVERDRQSVQRQIARLRSDAFWAGVFAEVRRRNALDAEAASEVQ